MRIPHAFCLFIFLAILAAAPAAFSQETDPAREKTRERLNALLLRVGRDRAVEYQELGSVCRRIAAVH